MMKFMSTLFKRLAKHDVGSYAAQGAYYLLLGFFPFIILIFMVITVLGVSYINDMDKLFVMFPQGTVDLVKGYLTYSKEISISVYSPLLITAIVISSNAMSSLTKAFNIAYDYSDDKRGFVKDRLISIGFVLLIVVMLTMLLLVSTLGPTLVNKISSLLQKDIIVDSVFNLMSFTFNFAVFLFIIGLMYYVMPARKATLIQIIPGVLFSTPTLAIFTQLFGYVVMNFTKYSIVYGSLTSIVVMLIWLFFSVLILIIGEEINAMFIIGKDKW